MEVGAGALVKGVRGSAQTASASRIRTRTLGSREEERPGRLCLALDLMEELRAPVVDRLMVSLVNRGQVGPGDFVEEISVPKLKPNALVACVAHAVMDRRVLQQRRPLVVAP